MDTAQPTPTDTTRHAEVAVVGAGFAGLAAAQLLGRAQRHVLLLGDGPIRNAETDHAHNILSRDGISPQELIRLGRQEVEGLPTVSFDPTLVERVDQPGTPDAPFTLTLATGEHLTADVVLLTTGVRDRLPAVKGLPELWGRRAHSCPFCDAEPYAGRRLLVVAGEPAAAHLTAILSGWTSQLTALPPEAIRTVQMEDGDVRVRTAEGVLTVDGLFVAAVPAPRLDLVAGLPLSRRGPFLATDNQGRTDIPGLWAAGDCSWSVADAIPGGQVIAAMADASRAAAAIVLAQAGVELPAAPPVEPPRTVDPHPDTHDHVHSMPDFDDDTDPVAFWEALYAGPQSRWTGLPNVGLVPVVEGLTPSTALDLGCGEGGDAVWLARRGWQVTAVDLSATAVARGRDAAAELEVQDHITWLAHDLAEGVPDGTFDLVVAAYLLSPVALPRDQILRQAMAAVAPGGTLVVLSHMGMGPGMETPHGVAFDSVEDQLTALAPGEGWDVFRAEEFSRRMLGQDQTVTHRDDTILVLRRHPG